MSRTATEVEAKKATTTQNDIRQATPLASNERPQRSRSAWTLAPLGLLAASAATFLVVRYWLRDGDDDGRLL